MCRTSSTTGRTDGILRRRTQKTGIFTESYLNENALQAGAPAAEFPKRFLLRTIFTSRCTQVQLRDQIVRSASEISSSVCVTGSFGAKQFFIPGAYSFRQSASDRKRIAFDCHLPPGGRQWAADGRGGVIRGGVSAAGKAYTEKGCRGQNPHGKSLPRAKPSQAKLTRKAAKQKTFQTGKE